MKTSFRDWNTTRGRKIDAEGGMLTLAEMQSCPVGTQYSAADATIIYPDGRVETWGELRRRRRGEDKQGQAA